MVTKPTYVPADKPKKKMKKKTSLNLIKRVKVVELRMNIYHKVSHVIVFGFQAHMFWSIGQMAKRCGNWGNKTKEEEFTPSQIAAVRIHRCRTQRKGSKVWKVMKGTKKMFGKTYNNCVKKEETNVSIEQTDLSHLDEVVGFEREWTNLMVVFTWRGKTYATQMFFPQTKKPTKAEILDAIRKVYPGINVLLNAVIRH